MGYNLENPQDFEEMCGKVDGEVVNIPAQGGGREKICQFDTLAGGSYYSDTPIDEATYMIYELNGTPMLEHIPNKYTGKDPIKSQGHASIILGGPEVQIDRFNGYQAAINTDDQPGVITLSLDTEEHRDLL